jgi:hypothetical protein
MGTPPGTTHPEALITRIVLPSGELGYLVGSQATRQVPPTVGFRSVVRFHLFHHPGQDYTLPNILCQVIHYLAVLPHVHRRTDIFEGLIHEFIYGAGQLSTWKKSTTGRLSS